MKKITIYQKGENLCRKFEKQIDYITRDLQKKDFFPVICNLFEHPAGVFTYQVLCYLGEGEGKKFEYSLLPGNKIRQIIHSNN